MALRVLLLTQWFDPEPAFKGLSFAKELARQGLNIEVVTGFPNYPGGMLYPGFKIKPLQYEFIDGIKITRVALYPSHNSSFIKRILNYATFAFSSLLYCIFFIRNVDVIYAYHPPLTVGVTASLIRLVRGIPVVYDIQDLWPDTLQATGMLKNEKLLSLVGKVCTQVYKKMDKIVVLSPGFKNILIKRGVPAEKIEIIYNWAAEDKLNTNLRDAQISVDGCEEFRLLFAGNMGAAQGLNAILEAASILKKREVPVKIIFVGAGLKLLELKNKASDLKLSNVLFLPPVPMSKIEAYLRSADALLVHLKNDKLFEITIPSKTQAYMSIGKPLLMAVRGDAANLIKLADCGVLAEPENPEDIAKSVEYMVNLTSQAREDMGRRGLDFYSQHFSLSVGGGKFKKVFEDVVQNNKKNH